MKKAKKKNSRQKAKLLGKKALRGNIKRTRIKGKIEKKGKTKPAGK